MSAPQVDNALARDKHTGDINCFVAVDRTLHLLAVVAFCVAYGAQFHSPAVAGDAAARQSVQVSAAPRALPQQEPTAARGDAPEVLGWKLRLVSETQRKGGESPDDCPPSLTSCTFLGIGICAHHTLIEKLAIAIALLEQQHLADGATLGIRSISAFQGNRSQGLHSLGVALDINPAANPYIMHEANETQLDTELAPIYERIAHFILGHPSLIPGLASLAPTQESRHERAAGFYDALAEESHAMQQYFQYMQDGLALKHYVHTGDGYRRACLPITFLSTFPGLCESEPRFQASLPPLLTDVTIDRIRQQMMADWVILTGRAGPVIVSLEGQSAGVSTLAPTLAYPEVASPVSDDPNKGGADRPFDTKDGAYLERSPLAGFLNLRKELVLALIDAGLFWGAIDLGPESGDMMHFDARRKPS